MRKVTCRVTGETGYSNEFYKAPNGKYYKSKELYENTMAQREYKTKILYLINSDILNKNTSNCASLIGKLINETGLEPNVIYESMLQKVDYIKKLIKESDESDSSKIHAIFSIATNRLNKVTYAGCYEIRNNKTDEIYIGESINLFGRFTEHISELYEDKHHCKALQEAFNKTKSISDFTITPLFMFPISAIDKNELKQETLYLESAFYIISKSNHEEFYNTKNPYIALKNNSVSLNGYEIDCKKVLNLLANDKYGVLPAKLLKIIRKNLQEDGLLNIENINKDKNILTTTTLPPRSNRKDLTPNADIENFEKTDLENIEKCIEYTNKLLEENVKLYRLTHILKDFTENNILPTDYDYAKIRQVLIENNLITIDTIGHTVATDYALENHFYFIDKVKVKNGIPVYNYYVSEKGKNLLYKIFSQYKDMNIFKKAS